MSQRLTAEQLGIPEDQYQALLWVRNALDPDVPDVVMPRWMRFDMDDWGGPVVKPRGNFCKSAFCIGGSMEVYLAGAVGAEDKKSRLAAVDRFDDMYLSVIERSHPLFALFFEFPEPRNKRTPTLAVAAIDRFLEGMVSDPWLTMSSRGAGWP